MHHIRPWKHWNDILLRFFTRSCGAAASEPAPGQQPVEVLRARKRPFPTALAEPIPGQLLVLHFVSGCNFFVCATPRFFYEAGVCTGPTSENPVFLLFLGELN
jgi:hypothetical protein